MAVEKEEFGLLKIVSKAVKEMSEGELLQIEKTRRLNITEDIYFDIIREKNCCINICCESGAASSGTSKENIKLMKEFGEKVGIAFRIKDDLFDYTQSPHNRKTNWIGYSREKNDTSINLYIK